MKKSPNLGIFSYCDSDNVLCGLFFVVDRHLTNQALLKRYERLGGHDTGDVLNLAVEQLHQVLVVASIELDHHGVTARGEVNLDNFRNLLQLGDNRLVH